MQYDYDYAFIDLSYYIFHKFYSTKNYCRLRDKKDEEFRECFTTGFRNGLVAFQKKHKFAWTSLVLARDCPRSTIWRNKFYDKYKGSREKNNTDFDPTIFQYVLDELVPELQKEFKFRVLQYDEAEGDDIIAICHRTIRSADNLNVLNILVISNDNDMIQMHDGNTTIINAMGVDIVSKLTKEMLDVYLEYKIIRGDISDNIPSIGKRIGEKTALKLALDPELLKTKMEDVDVLKQYELNKTLISFASIPDEIVKGIVGLWNEPLVV
jgi:5'-3' exonuclease